MVLQIITLSVLVMVVWLGFNVQAAYSLFLGGVSYMLPTALSVLILKILRPYPQLAGSALIGVEILKIVLTLIAMLLTFYFYGSLQFIPYFLGLLSVSHLVFLVYLKVHRYGK